jgi:uncharacterized membrane protein YhaH (DUF805 family)
MPASSQRTRTRFGRMGRKAYWASIATLVVISIALSFLHTRSLSSGASVVWIWLWIRRLHDTGRSGWYVLFPVGAIAAIVIVSFVAGSAELAAAFAHARTPGAPRTALTASGDALLLTMIVALFAVQFGYTLWLGLKLSEPRENQWGPPGGFYSTAETAKTFS